MEFGNSFSSYGYGLMDMMKRGETRRRETVGKVYWMTCEQKIWEMQKDVMNGDKKRQHSEIQHVQTL